MQPADFQTVPNICVQTGGASRLAEILTGIWPRSKKVFILSDKILLELGLLEGALTSLTANGWAHECYDGIVPDPPETIVLDAAAKAKSFGADIIIGFGGGSSMDTAKLVAALVGSSQALADMYGVDQVNGERLPLALIPTTAGTGSEVTPVSIVTVDGSQKKGVSSPVLYADLALLDAELTIGLPKHITAATAIDAMVHAIEAYTSKIHKNPVSDDLALRAIVKLQGNIELVCDNGADIRAREEVLLGAMLAGQAFANAPVAAVHALAYPLGGTFHVPHGLSNSLVLPAVLEFNSSVAEKEYSELASAMGLQASSAALIDEMVRIADVTGIERRLRDVGVSSSDLEQLADDAIKIERLLVNNPREMRREDILACYRDVF